MPRQKPLLHQIDSLTSPAPQLYRVRHLMTILGISKDAAYGLVNTGRIKSLRLSNKGTRIERRAIDEFILSVSQCKPDNVGKRGV